VAVTLYQEHEFARQFVEYQKSKLLEFSLTLRTTDAVNERPVIRAAEALVESMRVSVAGASQSVCRRYLLLGGGSLGCSLGRSFRCSFAWLFARLFASFRCSFAWLFAWSFVSLFVRLVVRFAVCVFDG
jgi:hypothetical protein